MVVGMVKFLVMLGATSEAESVVTDIAELDDTGMVVLANTEDMVALANMAGTLVENNPLSMASSL